MSMSTASAAPTTRCARWTSTQPPRGHVERAARALGAAAPETAYLDGPSSALLRRRPGALHDLANEVVLRVDQPVGHLHGGVDDLLPPGRTLAERRSVWSTVSTNLVTASIAARCPASSDLSTSSESSAVRSTRARLRGLRGLRGVTLASGRTLSCRRCAGPWSLAWDLPPLRDVGPVTHPSRKPHSGTREPRAPPPPPPLLRTVGHLGNDAIGREPGRDRTQLRPERLRGRRRAT